MKTCNKCNETKQLELFDKDLRNKDGRQGVCHECRKKAKQESRSKRKETNNIILKSEKTCNKCNVTKPISLFYKDHGIADGHMTICKECKSANVDKWREENRERYNENQRKQHKKHSLRNRLYRYDLTPEQYNQMLDEQNHVCAVCSKPPQGKRPLVVDHDHSDGKVRGLLCYGCNRALHVLDTPDLHDKATNYLKKAK